MKQVKNFALLFLFIFISISTTVAQNDEYRSVGSVAVGYSLTGAIVNALDDAIPDADVQIKSIPALQISYDYGLTKWLSVGLAGSLQTFKFDVTDYSYVGDDGETKTEDFTSDFKRSTVGLRVLFHYANSDKLDLYSGLRINLTNRNIKTESTDPNFDIEEALAISNGTRFGVGITAFGLRYFITDNIGLGIETHIGAPYVANFNVNARF